MLKWEYKIEVVEYTDDESYSEYSRRKWEDVWTEELNKHGKEGWELIKHTSSTNAIGYTTVRFYLKRRIE